MSMESEVHVRWTASGISTYDIRGKENVHKTPDAVRLNKAIRGIYVIYIKTY